eukprot:6491756-Amphidinium_carterae.2
MGYEGEFTPARKDKVLGRGKGGLAVLSRVGTPMLRATSCPHAAGGPWAVDACYPPGSAGGLPARSQSLWLGGRRVYSYMPLVKSS